MARLELTLLGGFTARLQPGEPIALPTRKAQALLAYLASPPGQSHPRDKLAALLWGDMAEAQARGSVRKALSWLRKELEASEALLIEGHNVTLDPGRVDVDVQAFENSVAQLDAEALQEAARLYTGDLLANLTLREPSFEEWLIAERERLHELATDGLARLLGHQRAASARDAAIQTALRLLALDPLRESVHRTLIGLFAETGRRAAALRQYQACVSALARELRAEPEAETKALYQRVLRARPVPAAAGTGPAPALADADASLGGTPQPRAVERTGPSSSDGPLVGRERELARLTEELDAAIAGRSRMVAILGEAGIGKSRLAAELIGLARRRGARAVVGHSYETERTLPFAPWVDAIRGAGLSQDERLLAALAPVWRGELARLLPELGGVSQTAGPGEALNLFEAIARLFEQAAAREPLLILLEDSHWADEMSMRLTHFLGRRLAGARCLFVATVRDEEAGSALLRQLGDELAREGILGRLHLDPLSREETLALVERLSPASPSGRDAAALADEVWRASEGHPLMAVETLRAAADDGGTAGTRERPLPTRVHQLITSRLDRLSERGQRLAAVAAVIGRQFEFGLLHRASDLSEDEAAEGVEELVRRRVLHQAGEGLAFSHDRVREVAYAALLRPRRTLLHRRVAEAMETMRGKSAGAHALGIGTHYREGEVWERAVTFLQQAGFQAAARASSRDAVSAYDQALTAVERLPESPATLAQASDLRFSLGHARYVLGDFEAATESYRAAEALSRRLGDDRRRGYVLAGMSYLLDTAGGHDAAAQAGEEALAIGSAIDDRPLRVWSSLSLGRARFAMGQHRRGSEHMRAVARAIEGTPPGERFGRASILASVATPAWLALCLAGMGEFAEAVGLGDDAVRMARAVGGPAESVAAHYALARVHLGRAHLDRAIAVHEAALPQCRAGSIPIYTPRFLASLGSAYAQSGRMDEALALMDEAVELARSRQLAYGQSLVLVQLGEALLLAGRVDEAGRATREALDLARGRGERGDEAWALHTLGAVASEDDADTEQAVARYQEALALAADLEMRPLLARCHLSLGTAHRRSSREVDARRHLALAAEALRAMDMGVWVARAEALLA